jgi:hypothetical protein
MNVSIGKEYKTTSRTDGWMWKFDDERETHGLDFAAAQAKKRGVPCSMVIEHMRIVAQRELGLPMLLHRMETAMDSYKAMVFIAERDSAADLWDRRGIVTTFGGKVMTVNFN